MTDSSQVSNLVERATRAATQSERFALVANTKAKEIVELLMNLEFLVGAARIASEGAKQSAISSRQAYSQITQAINEMITRDQLGSAAFLDIGNLFGTVAAGDDSRFLDIGTTPGTVAAGDDSRFLSIGTTPGTVAAGDDPRLFDARTPLAHSASHAPGQADEFSLKTINGQSLYGSGDIVIATGSTGTSGGSGGVVPGTWIQSATAQSWFGVASSSDGTKLVASIINGYLWTSTDSGATWTQRATSRAWRSVASSSDGTKLVAVAYNGYIWTSADSGVTWTQRASSQGWTGCTSSSDGTKLVAVTNGSYLWTSSDSGVTWTQRATSRAWRSVASSADGTKLVAVARDASYIYTSTDSGVTWTARATAQSWVSCASSSDGTKLVANIEGGYIWTSIDSGVTWTQRATLQTWVGCASSSDGTKLVATCSGYIYKSEDSGNTWTQQATSQTWQNCASSSSGTKLVAVTSGGYIWTYDYSSYIATPTATPSFGDPLDGGFYAGMIWNELAESNDSLAISTGFHIFNVPDMTIVPLVYVGQTLEVRSRANPANRMIGTVYSAAGTNLTLNINSAMGSGTFSDWSVMAQYRIIVAPKASGETTLAVKNANSAQPSACGTLTEGKKATDAMVAAADSTVYPAAWFCHNLNIGGKTDWYLPAIDELELCWRNLKPVTYANYATSDKQIAATPNYTNLGSYGSLSNYHGVNNNSSPAGSAYTSGSPAQVAAGKNFRIGESEAFANLYSYWSSTEYSTTNAWSQSWTSSYAGVQFNYAKSDADHVRAVRRSII